MKFPFGSITRIQNGVSNSWFNLQYRLSVDDLMAATDPERTKKKQKRKRSPSPDRKQKRKR